MTRHSGTEEVDIYKHHRLLEEEHSHLSKENLQSQNQIIALIKHFALK